MDRMATSSDTSARSGADTPGGGIRGNPAVAIGGMVMGLLSWSDIWIYLIANFAGGAAAAAVFLYTQPGEKERGDVRAAEPGGDVPEGGRV